MIKCTKKNKAILKRRKVTLSLLVLVTFFGLIFYVGDKFYNNRTIATFTKNITKATKSKPSTDVRMNLRESKVH